MKPEREKPLATAPPSDAPPAQTEPAGALSKGLRWVLERSSEPGEFDVLFRVTTPAHSDGSGAT